MQGQMACKRSVSLYLDTVSVPGKYANLVHKQEFDSFKSSKIIHNVLIINDYTLFEHFCSIFSTKNGQKATLARITFFGYIHAFCFVGAPSHASGSSFSEKHPPRAS